MPASPLKLEFIDSSGASFRIWSTYAFVLRVSKPQVHFMEDRLKQWHEDFAFVVYGATARGV